MAFCVKCGTQLTDGAKFCVSCGTPAGVIAPVPAKPVTTEKVGNIRKCPACGETVESFQTRCSSCGHEFRGSGEVSSGIQKFVDQINEVDVEIARLPSSASGQAGWDSWSVWQKIGFVILIFCTNGVALIIYLIVRIFVKPKWKLSPIEQRKQGIIANFIVPNNREDLTETMLFTVAKMRESFETSDSTGKLKAWHVFWTQIWINKSRQVIDKAKLSMANEWDKVEVLNKAIKDGEDFIKKDKMMKVVRLIVTIAVVIVILAAIGNVAYQLFSFIREYLLY